MECGSTGEIQLENEFFCVTKWTIEPGGMIPMHQHHYDYVVVPLVTTSMYVVDAEGRESRADLVAGTSYTRSAGAVHQVENRGTTDTVVFVEVERLA